MILREIGANGMADGMARRMSLNCRISPKGGQFQSLIVVLGTPGSSVPSCSMAMNLPFLQSLPESIP